MSDSNTPSDETIAEIHDQLDADADPVSLIDEHGASTFMTALEQWRPPAPPITEVGIDTYDNDGACDRCLDEPCPWDMPAIRIPDRAGGTCWYCSPECARDAIDDVGEQPTHIIVHDPQGHVDHEAFDADEDTVDIVLAVDNMDHAHRLLDRATENHRGPFRPEI